MLNLSGPVISDYYMVDHSRIPVNARTGKYYSFYTSSPSLVALPLMFLSLHVLVSVVQAFLFMALAMSYLSLAVAEEH